MSSDSKEARSYTILWSFSERCQALNKQRRSHMIREEGSATRVIICDSPEARFNTRRDLIGFTEAGLGKAEIL